MSDPRCGTRAGSALHDRRGEPRCEQCKAANAAYARRRARYGWAEQVAANWTDAGPARAHIAALRAQGIGKRRIAELAGVSLSTVDTIVYGKHRSGPAVRILARNAEAILAVRPDHAPSAIIDATGTVRRIRALQAIGWTLAGIGAHVDIRASNLGTIASGRRAVTAATAARIAAAYERLCMTRGTSRLVHVAARKGWVPPLAWGEDIDDPDAEPIHSGEPVELDEVAVQRLIDGTCTWRDLTRTERIEAARRMDGAGVSRNTIADRTALNTATLYREAYRREAS